MKRVHTCLFRGVDPFFLDQFPTFMKFKHSLTLLFLFVFVLTGLRAEQPTSIELVLDGSASMWNKLEDGRYRIDAAKQVLSEFLVTTQEAPNLHIGLRIYGSKVAFSKPGACQDTELVVAIEGFERQRMLEAVRKARAIGATPLARSLELAKDDFKKEGTRRLILFTDGEESCGGDVAAALAALKAAGVEVDVRIIGIGLSKEATARFAKMGVPVENVHTARKLAEALGKAAEIKPAPARKAAFTLRLIRDGRPFAGAVPEMSGALSGKGVKLEPTGEGSFAGETEAGVYEARVGERKFENLSIALGEKNELVLDLTQAPKVDLTVEPAIGGKIGSDVTVHFKNARGEKDEFVVIAPEGAPDLAEPTWAYTAEEREGSVKLRVLGEPGRYEARFITKINGRNVLAGRSQPFELTLPEVSLKVPDTVAATTRFEVEWSGPANQADWIGWVKAGAADGAYELYTRPEEGKTSVTLTAPAEPGEYEVRYANDLSPVVLARVALKVVASEYSLKSPEEIMAGTSVEIEWNAPPSPGVYVTIVTADAGPAGYTDYFYTADSTSPTRLQAPRTVGRHEVRISTEIKHAILHRRPITLTAMKATLEAPAQASAAASIEVKWTGPNGKGDFVTVTAPDAEGSAYTEYFYTNDTAAEGKGELKLPKEPGRYELRYVAGNQVVERKAIAVE